jgi:hypothetical protein
LLPRILNDTAAPINIGARESGKTKEVIQPMIESFCSSRKFSWCETIRIRIFLSPGRKGAKFEGEK